jgi:hypothetical protein
MVALGLLRAFGVTTGLIALYYLAPLDRMANLPLWGSLTAGVLLLIALTAHQMRAILRAAQPGIRAVEALAITAPLFLLLFAAAYFLLAQNASDNFSVQALTRTDALYFTVTVFATVGFGDITATSESARILVTVQMILNLIILGLVVRLFLGAVQHARKEDPTPFGGV